MKKYNTLSTFIKICFRISPTYIPLTILATLFDAAFILVGIYFPKLIIDGMLNLDLSVIVKQESLLAFWPQVKDQMLPLVYIIMFIMVFNFVMRVITKYINKHLQTKRIEINELFYQELSKKIMNLEYEKIEDPYILDLKERAVFASTNQGAITSLISSLTNILKAIFTIIGVVAIILTLNVYLLIIILFLVILSVVLTFAFKNYQTKVYQKIIPVNRQFSYYVSLMHDNTITKDIRIYDIGKIFTHKMYHFNLQINNEFRQMGKLQGLYLSATDMLSNLQLALVYLYMGYLAIFEGLSIGSLTMYVQASQRFANSLQQLFQSIAGIRQTIHYLEPFMEFMNLEEANIACGKEYLEEINTIEFRNVSFSYPRSDKKVLDNISFKINQGEKISIVGLNGAGKTTLIKILCRLYQPSEGEILINGININDYDYDSYLSRISAIFQDFKIFAFSIKENIMLTEVEDQARLEKVIKKNNLTEMIDNLPNGIETMLHKMFDKDGTELSYGQNQKIAISRALYKNSDLIILDEPTSALDPIAEYEVYNDFNNLIENKTAIYISHRMSSSIFCDKILVIEDGKVAAFNRHQELLKDKNSLYYKMFTTQAKNYTLPQES